MAPKPAHQYRLRGTRLGVRLVLAMVGLVVVTATGVGWLVSRNIDRIVVPTALERLDNIARRRAADLRSFAEDVRFAVQGDRKTAPVAGIVRASLAGGFDKQDNSTLEQWKRRLAQNFEAVVSGRPSFFKYRFIGLAGGGREIVRVDRMTSDGSIRIVPENLLQAKGERGFFQRAIAVKDGEIYASPIELNQDYGRVAVPYVPVYRVATPVTTPSGKPFGIIIANIDMRIFFDEIRQREVEGFHNYVVDETGNYLMNPNRKLEFGSDLEVKTNWHADFPEVANIFSTPSGYLRGKGQGPDGLRYTVAIAVDLGSDRKVAVIETMHNETVQALASETRRTSLLAGLGASLAAVILAIVVARSLSKPLEKLTHAVQSFDGRNQIEVPLSGSAETVSLAQSFNQMATDIRERTEELRTIHEKERLYGAVVESSSDAILTVGLDGKITAWNPAAEKLFGYTAQEAIGASPRIITPPERLRESEDYMTRVLAGEGIEHVEVVRIDKRGRPIDVSVTVSPVFDAAGKVISLSMIVRDITEFNRISSRLRQTQKLESIGTLAGGIAHDFNNIIAAIVGNVALARADLPEGHPALASVEEIEKAGKRAAEIVRQILKFSRVDEGEQRVVLIGPVVEEAVQFLKRTAPPNIDFEVDIEPDLPPISASATELHQVLMNLGVNAFHAMSEQGGTLGIRASRLVLDKVGAEVYPDLGPGTYVRLNVRDTGVGMDAAALERAFEPFFSTKASGKGTGLGLSTVYGIVKAHRGTITVYSDVGKGTVFRIYLPVATSEVTEESPSPTGLTSGHGEKILYVDDDEALVTMTKRMLDKLNYDVYGFDSPLEALAAFSVDPASFDVIVTDMSMPKMSGPEFVVKVKEIRPDIPVIMLTGYIRPEDTQRTAHLGIRRLMLKPNTVQDLSEALREVLEEIWSGKASTG